MKAFADKLINITRHHSEEISRQWCRAVKTNPRTISYHAVPDETLIKQATGFYKNLRQIYFSEKPYYELQDFFGRYAEESIERGIPLHECIYALILMRRHLWLFADFQKPFLENLDESQKIGTINNTIRIFDYGIFLIIRKYDELTP